MKYILEYNSFSILESEDYVLLSGIKQKDVHIIKDDIIKNLLPLLLLKEEDLFFAGSAGKLSDPEEISKNINIIIDSKSLIDSNNFDISVLDFLKSQVDRLKYNSVIKDNDSLLVDWPFNDMNIDVIIHPSLNYDWIKFTRYCPDILNGESEYNGKYREAILSAITESINKKIVSYDDQNDNVREYSKLIFDRNRGMYIIHKSFLGPHGTLTKAYEVKGSRKLITSNPDKFVNILFGDDITKDDLMTFENILDIIKDQDYKFYNKLHQIKSRFYKNCMKLNITPLTL